MALLPAGASSVVPTTPPKTEPKSTLIKLGSTDPLIEQVRQETGDRFEAADVFNRLAKAEAAKAKFPWRRERSRSPAVPRRYEFTKKHPPGRIVVSPWNENWMPVTPPTAEQLGLPNSPVTPPPVEEEREAPTRDVLPESVFPTTPANFEPTRQDSVPGLPRTYWNLAVKEEEEEDDEPGDEPPPLDAPPPESSTSEADSDQESSSYSEDRANASVLFPDLTPDNTLEGVSRGHMTASRPGRPTRTWLRRQGMDSDIASETSDESGEGDEEMLDTTEEDKPLLELSMKDEPKFEEEGNAPWVEKTPASDTPRQPSPPQPTTTPSTRIDPKPAAMDLSGGGVQGDTPTSTRVNPEPAAKDSSGG
eukprot:7314095-Karenia_brevis.AAC.1